MAQLRQAEAARDERIHVDAHDEMERERASDMSEKASRMLLSLMLVAASLSNIDVVSLAAFVALSMALFTSSIGTTSRFSPLLTSSWRANLICTVSMVSVF